MSFFQTKTPNKPKEPKMLATFLWLEWSRKWETMEVKKDLVGKHYIEILNVFYKIELDPEQDTGILHYQDREIHCEVFKV